MLVRREGLRLSLNVQVLSKSFDCIDLELIYVELAKVEVHEEQTQTSASNYKDD
jgi:hypothetical protein